MPTQDIIIFEPVTSAEAEALKAFGKALKLKFKVCENAAASDKQAIIDNITTGLRETNQIEKGEKKGTLLKKFLDEF